MKELKPIVLRNTENGDTYTLEFSRESVRFAELKGFDINDVEKYPMTKVPELFYYAFREHHKNVARDKTDKILFEELGGLTPAMIERLGMLYVEPFNTLANDGTETKNSKMTVEM